MHQYIIFLSTFKVHFNPVWPALLINMLLYLIHVGHFIFQVFVFLNRKTTLLDTTSSRPSYHQVSDDIIYTEHRYEFHTLGDVDRYWYEMWNFCIHTQLGMSMWRKPSYFNWTLYKRKAVKSSWVISCFIMDLNIDSILTHLIFSQDFIVFTCYESFKFWGRWHPISRTGTHLM